MYRVLIRDTFDPFESSYEYTFEELIRKYNLSSKELKTLAKGEQVFREGFAQDTYIRKMV